MQNMNKKGLAEVVGAISLVLLAAVAAVIIAGYMNNFLFANKVMYSSGISCLEMQTGSLIDIRNACYNSQTGGVEIKVERSLSNIEIREIDFNIAGERYSCGESCGVCEVLGAGEIKDYYFEIGKNIVGEKAAIHVDGCVLDEVEIRGSC